MQTLGPGDVLGLVVALDAAPAGTSAPSTVKAVTAVEFDTDRLRALAEHGSGARATSWRAGFSRPLLERLQSTRARLLDLYGSPRER